jgi:hypothetical protein
MQRKKGKPVTLDDVRRVLGEMGCWCTAAEVAALRGWKGATATSSPVVVARRCLVKLVGGRLAESRRRAEPAAIGRKPAEFRLLPGALALPLPKPRLRPGVGGGLRRGEVERRARSFAAGVRALHKEFVRKVLDLQREFLASLPG